MSTATPPIAAIPQLLAAGNQAISTIAEPMAGTQALPEVGENNHFTQVLSQFLQNNNGAVPLPEYLSGLHSGVAEQVLPEQGSVLPLEGKLLPQNLIAAAEAAVENLVDLPLPETAQSYTSDQDPLGLMISDLVKPQPGSAINNPLASGQLAQTPASMMLASATANRVTTDPALQTVQASSLQQGQDAAMIDLGDAAMQSDGEQGRKDNFLQGMQEMRLTSLSQAISDNSNQALSANRETVASLMNTATSTAAVIPEAAKPTGLPTLSLHGPLNRPEWRDEMASRVSWLVRNDQSAAQLRINPAHLGPMEISIKISQDQASVSFVSQHMQVREAVELAIPRLREMLEQQGLNLADVDISSGYSKAGHPGSGSADDTGVSDNEQALNGSDSTDPDGNDATHTLSAVLETDQGNGILDEYV